MAPPGRWASLLLIAAVAVLLSLPALDGDFLADDFAYVRLGPRPLADFLRFGDLTEAAWGGSRPLDEPRPLFVLTHKLGFLLFGVHPAGHLAINLALHAGCALLVFLLVELLVAAPAWTPLLAGLLFAVAPAHAEPIAWISGRVDVLAMLFFLAAFACHLRHERDGRARHRWLALLAFALGLLSKETVATLPIVLLARGALFGEGAGRARAVALLRRASSVLPLLAVAALYAALRLASFGSVAREERLSLARGLEFLARQLYYFKYIVIPFPGYVGEAPVPGASLVPAGIVLAVLAAGVVAMLWARAPERREVVFFGVLFYAITILPLLMTYRSARHLYMPSLGFAIAVAFLLLPPRARLAPWRFAAAGLLLLLFALELRALEAPWTAAGEVSRRLRTGIEALTRDLAPGAVVLLPDAPLSRGGVLGWDSALPFALQPPFAARDIPASLRLLEHPRLYCCPTRTWWRERRAVLAGLVQDVDARDVFLLTWNPGRGAVVRYRAVLFPQEIRGVLEESLAAPLESVEDVDARDGARLIQELAFAVRRAD